jgi:Family of unknown function (DUF6247)
MTEPRARPPRVLPRPACRHAAIRAVLAASADAAVLQSYDRDIDAAYEQARETGDLTHLTETVRRWWFEADAWRDPGAQREFLARLNSYRAEGPPPPGERMTRQEVHARFGV